MGSRVLLCVINMFYTFRFFCKCACCTALRKIPRLLCSSYHTLCRRYAAQRRLCRAAAVPASHTITRNRPQGSVVGSRVLLCVINMFYTFRFFCKCACCTALRKIPRLLCSSFRTLCRRYAAQRRLRRAVAVPASPTITKNRPQGSVS